MTLVYFSSCEPSNHDYIFTYYFIFVFFSLFIYNELAFPMLGPPRFWLVTNHHADIFLFFPQEKRIHLFFSIHILVFFFFLENYFLSLILESWNRNYICTLHNWLIQSLSCSAFTCLSVLLLSQYHTTL